MTFFDESSKASKEFVQHLLYISQSNIRKLKNKFHASQKMKCSKTKWNVQKPNEVHTLFSYTLSKIQLLRNCLNFDMGELQFCGKRDSLLRSFFGKQKISRAGNGPSISRGNTDVTNNPTLLTSPPANKKWESVWNVLPFHCKVGHQIPLLQNNKNLFRINYFIR